MTFLSSLSAALVIGLAFLSQTKPPGPVTTREPCRTYDTSVRSVTVGGGMTITVDTSGVFDPWTLRLVQNVSYSSTGGSRFQYVQTTTYDSAEDFIAEVIRLKPPAGLPTTPGATMVTDVIPPLVRARRTVATGQIGLTMTNSYDSTNRRTGFDTKTGQYLISTRYSAWDSSGRPTAGTMTGPTGNSTVTFSYDEKGLSQTQTTTTQGLVNTITTTYDQFGNPRSGSSTITRGASSTTTYTSQSTAKLCLLDLRAAPAPPTKPLGPNPNGTFTGTIAGQSFTSSTGLKAENNAPVVSVGAGNGRYIVSIAVAAKAGPGEYKAGPPPDDTNWVKMSEKEFKDLFDHNTVVATVWDTQTKQGWQASPTIGKGSVNLTSVAGTMAGTFALTLDAIPGTGASGSISFNGSFNVKY